MHQRPKANGNHSWGDTATAALTKALLKIWNFTTWTWWLLQVSSFTTVYLNQYSPPSIRNGKRRGWEKHKLPQSNKKIAMLFFFFLAKSPANRTVNLQTQWDWSEITSSQMLARVHQQHATISLLQEGGNLGHFYSHCSNINLKFLNRARTLKNWKHWSGKYNGRSSVPWFYSTALHNLCILIHRNLRVKPPYGEKEQNWKWFLSLCFNPLLWK